MTIPIQIIPNRIGTYEFYDHCILVLKKPTGWFNGPLGHSSYFFTVIDTIQGAWGTPFLPQKTKHLQKFAGTSPLPHTLSAKRKAQHLESKLWTYSLLALKYTV